MRLVSFNINGVRARPHQLEALVASHAPDVIGLQETKVQDSEFPVRPWKRWVTTSISMARKVTMAWP